VPWKAGYTGYAANCCDGLPAKKETGIRAYPWNPSKEQGFDPADPSPGTEEQVVAAEEKKRLREAITLLPEDQREALIMTQLEKVPYEEAAKLLGVSEGTVKSRVNRAKARLKEILSEARELSPPGNVQRDERRLRS
jgi:RNA polymerase sigma factor, sigma-70 family